MRINILFCSASILFSACGIVPHSEFQALNKGYLYDSLKYQEQISIPHVHDSLELNELAYNYLHTDYCPYFGYIPYEKLPYRGKCVEKVIEIEGQPSVQAIDTLYYGYKIEQGVPTFGVLYFSDHDYCESNDQEYYRVASILNNPINIVHVYDWRNEKRYLILYYLEFDGKGVGPFWGFQSKPDYIFQH